MPQVTIAKVFRKRQRATKRPSRQNPPRSAKSQRTTIPPLQVERIRQRYVAGESIRKIAREEKRDQETVSKIVKGPEIQVYVENLREQYYGLGEFAAQPQTAPSSKMPDWQVAAGGKMEFDVVSVKRNAADMSPQTNIPLGPGDYYSPTGGLFSVTSARLFSYITFAYKILKPCSVGT